MTVHYSLPGPEWCRTMWVSPAAEALWRPRIRAINDEWHAAERASVGAFRDACLTMATPEQLPELAAKATEQRLTLLVLEQTAASATYQAAAAAPDGGPWQYRIAFVASHRASEFHAAWASGDQVRVGELLGFPACCTSFFQRVWVDEGWRDTTWPMAGPTEPEPDIIVTDPGPTACNILLRWVGVRWVPHLPCSFDCDGTALLGADFRHFVPTTIAGWLDELLEMPIEWSARNGIAEIKTPLFTVSAKTDVIPGVRCVQRHGRRYPAGGAGGLRFPYEPMAGPPAVDTWSANGFVDEISMLKAHHVVASVVNAGGTHDTVIDVGCGNGLLLERVNAKKKIGYEVDPDRAAAAGGRDIEVITGDVLDVLCFPRADLALVMPGRIIEAGSRGERLIKALRGSCRGLVVYAYSDWLDAGGLNALCRRAALPGHLASAVAAHGVEVGVWRWS